MVLQNQTPASTGSAEDSAADLAHAHFDTLTRLPNRDLLYNRLEETVRLARRENKHLAILFLGLENFKIINNSMGHDAGDKVMAEMAKQLKGFVRAGDIVSRWNENEFVIVLWDCGVDGASLVSNKLTSSDVKVGGIAVAVSLRAGISIFPEDGEDPQTLLTNADIALSRLNRSAIQHYEFFSPAMNTHVQERILLESEIRRALEQNEFALFYQPRINILTGKISGVEALLRWVHPTKGIILPTDFLHVAEESGLIRRISEWVLLNACRQSQFWQRLVSPLPVAVNIAPAYFRMPEFEEVIRATLWETKLAPECLELELTENTIFADLEKTFARLAIIKSMGVQLSIDNFGTGYYSLLLLKKLQVNKLKIDGSFVKDLTPNQEGLDLVRSIISVGHIMKATVVAEGVENSSQFSLLKKEGCDEAQGFFFCRPAPAEELTSLISSHRVFRDCENSSVGFSEVTTNTPPDTTSLKMVTSWSDFPDPGRPLFRKF